jgi:hypothetical protein
MGSRNSNEDNPDDFDGVDWAERLLGPDMYEQLTEESEKIEREGLYTRDWDFVSYEFRKSKDFTCEYCGVVLSEHKNKRLLHVHHIDHNKGNNSPHNLKALCVLCHCAQHPHMTAEIIDTQIIEELRQKRIDAIK